MTIRDNLIASATVGLGMKPADLDAWPAILRPEMAEESSASTTLDAAALLTVARRAAGALESDPWPGGTPPVSPEPKPWPPAARGALRQLLSERAEIVAAALRVLANHQAGLPIRDLPELATKALAPGSPLRDVLATAAGPRGRWLLQQNPAWRPLISVAETSEPELDDDDWLHGSLTQRVAWLTHQRSLDAEAGRAALTSVWKQQKAAEKTALLTALATGLGPDDVEFLDDARTDRSSQVGQAARCLLARIPTGAYAERRAQMIASHFQLTKTFLGKPRLFVTELASDPKEGIAAGAEHGVVSFIATTPLALWASVLGYQPVELAGLTQTGVSFDAAKAFLSAASLQRDPEVLEQMIAAMPDPWDLISPEDLASLPYDTRMKITRRAIGELEQNGVTKAIAWLGSPLPVEIIDDCLDAIAGFPQILDSAQTGPALLASRPDQVAKLHLIAETAPDPHQNAARRALQYLTLLSRLDQELS